MRQLRYFNILSYDECKSTETSWRLALKQFCSVKSLSVYSCITAKSALEESDSDSFFTSEVSVFGIYNFYSFHIHAQ